MSHAIFGTYLYLKNDPLHIWNSNSTPWPISSFEKSDTPLHKPWSKWGGRGDAGPDPGVSLHAHRYCWVNPQMEAKLNQNKIQLIDYINLMLRDSFPSRDQAKFVKVKLFSFTVKRCEFLFQFHILRLINFFSFSFPFLSFSFFPSFLLPLFLATVITLFCAHRIFSCSLWILNSVGIFSCGIGCLVLWPGIGPLDL